MRDGGEWVPYPSAPTENSFRGHPRLFPIAFLKTTQASRKKISMEKFHDIVINALLMGLLEDMDIADVYDHIAGQLALHT